MWGNDTIYIYIKHLRKNSEKDGHKGEESSYILMYIACFIVSRIGQICAAVPTYLETYFIMKMVDFE